MNNEDRPAASLRDDQRTANESPVGNVENAVTGVVSATADLARTAIEEVSGVAEELVHAMGRVGVATVSEIMNVIGSVTGGIGRAAGQTMNRRSRRDARREREATGEEGSTGYPTQSTVA